MRRLLLPLSLLAFLILPTWAYADGCTSYTITTPTGTKFCQQCCYQGNCTVTCL